MGVKSLVQGLKFGKILEAVQFDENPTITLFSHQPYDTESPMLY